MDRDAGEIDVELSVGEVSPQVLFSQKAPRDHLSCHARRPSGTGSPSLHAAGGRTPATGHPHVPQIRETPTG